MDAFGYVSTERAGLAAEAEWILRKNLSLLGRADAYRDFKEKRFGASAIGGLRMRF